MSSTTDDRRHNERGQIIVLMAGGMIGIVLIAALVFDVGQNLLDRRNQQNAADAAALAGARFLAMPACKPVNSVQPPCPAAVAAAIDVAARNGYADGVDSHTVDVHIPPNAQSSFSRFPGHIQVVLGGTRGSFFSGVIGVVSQNVATQAVAANIEDFSLPFALLALNETECGAVHITGNGTININADIQVNSNCNTSGAFQIGGSGATVNALSATCSATGTIKVNSGSLNCDRQEYVEPQLFPEIGGPGVQPMPASPDLTGGITTGQPNKWTIGTACPGQASAATLVAPGTCKIQSGKPDTAGVHLHPGMYPGGLLLTQAPGDAQLSVYLEPGIYYIAGGGLEIQGNIVLRSVEAGGGTTFDVSSATMGVLIYNADNPEYLNACLGGGGAPANACIETIDFQTGPTALVELRGNKIDTAFKNLLLFQDPNASDQPPLSMEGHSAQKLVGTIYLPEANFSYSGNGAGEALQAQIIVDTLDVSGGGTLDINYDASAVFQFKGIGLVQ